MRVTRRLILQKARHQATGRPKPNRQHPLTACGHVVSGTVSLPSSGCFSPFPHGTCSLSVAEEYLGLESGLPMFRQDCTCPALLESSVHRNPYGAVTHCGPTFQSVPVRKNRRTGLVRVRSPLLTE